MHFASTYHSVKKLATTLVLSIDPCGQIATVCIDFQASVSKVCPNNYRQQCALAHFHKAIMEFRVISKASKKMNPSHYSH